MSTEMIRNNFTVSRIHNKYAGNDFILTLKGFDWTEMRANKTRSGRSVSISEKAHPEQSVCPDDWQKLTRKLTRVIARSKVEAVDLN